MADYDARVRVGTSVDTAPMEKLQVKINKATEKAAELSKKLATLKNEKVPTEEYQNVLKQIEKAENRLGGLIQKQDKMNALGEKSRGAWKSLQYDIEETKNTIAYAKSEIEDLKETGKDFTIGGNTEEIGKTAAKLAEVEAELRGLNAEQEELLQKQDREATGFRKIADAGKKCCKGISDSAKESTGFFTALSKQLKGFMLNLLVFNWVSKGFGAIGSALREGSQNLAQYSQKYNASISALKGQTLQLKNSLAVAFAPVVATIIPYLVQLISWLNRAADTVAQFLAVLQGKNIYTKAKEQVVDYAQSLKTASKETKGMLAAFDDLNVLNKNGTNATGREGTAGTNAFEEAKVNPEIYEMLEKAKKLLGFIKILTAAIEVSLLAWSVAGFLENLGVVNNRLKFTIGLLLSVAGAAISVCAYLDMWKNGVDWEGIGKYIAGVATAVAGLGIMLGKLGAGIGLLVFSAAGLVLAFKDIMENGFTTENMVLELVSAFGLIVAVFLTFGATAAIVVGAIMAVIAAIAGIIAWAGKGEEALATLKRMMGHVGEFAKSVLAGDFKSAFAAITEFAKENMNMSNLFVESFVNGIIKALNMLIDSVNALFEKIPDWALGPVGISKIPNISWQLELPRLAEGAVIQGGRPFAAILGDQHFGQTNVETPLDTIKQAVAEVVGNGRGQEPVVHVYIGNHELEDYIIQTGNRNALRSGGR